jgi:hypothetical protein
MKELTKPILDEVPESVFKQSRRVLLTPIKQKTEPE